VKQDGLAISSSSRQKRHDRRARGQAQFRNEHESKRDMTHAKSARRLSLVVV
jgi:hypothetical protein